MRIDHVALYCVDLEGMKDFFIRFFDARCNRLYHNPKTGLKAYFLSFTEGGSRLEIMSRPEVTEANNQLFDSGFIHLCINVGSAEQVDLLTRKLSEAGYQVHSGPRVTGDGYYESSIIGPEGIQVEITI